MACRNFEIIYVTHVVFQLDSAYLETWPLDLSHLITFWLFAFFFFLHFFCSTFSSVDPGLLECCFISQPLSTFALGLATVWLSGRGAYLKEMSACYFIRLPLLSTCGSRGGALPSCRLYKWDLSWLPWNSK